MAQVSPGSTERLDDEDGGAPEGTGRLLLHIDSAGLVWWAHDDGSGVGGRPAEHFVGSSAAELVHAEDLPAVVAAANRAGPAGVDDRPIRLRLRQPDGSWRPFYSLGLGPAGDFADRFLVVLWPSGASMPSFVRDWHDRRQDQLARAGFLTGHGAIVLVDRDGVAAFASRSVETLGYEVGDLLGHRPEDWVVPEDRSLIAGSLARCRLEPGDPVEVTVRHRLPDGRERWIESTLVNRLDDAAVAGIVITLRDITERVVVEEALRAREAWFRALVLHATDLLVVADTAGAIRYASPGTSMVLGVEADTVIGQDLRAHVHRADLPGVEQAIADALGRPGQLIDVSARVHGADGRWRLLEGCLRHPPPGEGVDGLVLNLHDVTDRQEAIEGLDASERRFRKLVQNGSDLILVVDDQACIRWISPAVTRVLGLDPEEITGRLTTEFLHPDDVAAVLDSLEAQTEGGRPTATAVGRVRAADGTWRTLGMLATDLSDDPDVGGILINARDITDDIAAQARSLRLSSIVEAANDLIGIYDIRSRRVALNAAAREFLGLPDDAEQTLEALMERLPPNFTAHWRNEIAPALQQSGSWSGEMSGLNRTGEPVALSWSITAHGADISEPDAISFIARDIRDRKALEHRLEHQATHDPLTGLPNRTLVLDRLRVALARTLRRGGEVAVLFADLDDFKVVNDSLGHEMGDRLLEVLASRLVSAVRPGDTVGRFGGDEFVVVCEDVDGHESASLVAERLAETLTQPVGLDGTEVVVSASVGIALASQASTTAEDLLRDADSAMYEAKARGRARAEIFDLAMRTRAVARLELEGSLRRAVERRELRLRFQPQVDLRTGATVGFEALLRWEHPERGLLEPDEFLGVAEGSRLIVPVGRWVLQQSSRILDRLCAAEGAGPLWLGVNLSARELTDSRLVDTVREVLADMAAPPGSLQLEITEGVLMEDVESSLVTLERLKELGVQLAIDDFGTGYSSLARLRGFPVDVLKIDRSFVAGLGTDPGDSAIVASIVHLAHALGMRATAEGVEEELQLDELRRLGCDVAQGFLLGRPLADADAIELLAGGPASRA
ncbi:MAG: EAL domain-containing protein [Actinobacteria bacterium]|nr:EAL domain-containing protein [Actinomycetota bacterium]